MRSTPANSHVPVLRAEVLEILRPQPGAVVVDCTLGAGGHSFELLKRIGPTGRLIGCDLDADNLQRVEPMLATIGHPFVLHHTNFAALPKIVVDGADAILADLGVSSMQIDDPERGFSYRRPGPLDMRMDQSRGKTAAQLLNTISVEDLARALIEYGDFAEFGPDAAGHLAAAIVQHRQQLSTTTELSELILNTTPPPPPPIGKRVKPWQLKYRPVACAYQALRILVNRELANLEALLRAAPMVLRPGGRIAIISFHSGEDRLVKSSFAARRHDETYSEVSKDPIRPTQAERWNNPRARSAKLRWARRTGV
jgi:16S rRNA (cytosine1402-N4)-methyltransferase